MGGNRLEIIDLARGLALVAMTIFHFTFDLELFGLQERGFINQPHWIYFARFIASSFLILTGFSLYLAHASDMNWGKWRWRLLKIVSAAIIITIATIFATPDQFIFFGILHQIAFASAVGLLFLKLTWHVLTVLAIGVFLLPKYFKTELLDAPVFWWTGIQDFTPTSSDYVPVFPWFSAVLIGIALAKIISKSSLMERMGAWEFNAAPARLLRFMGRNSLVYYLLHQPVMIALLFSFLWITGRLG